MCLRIISLPHDKIPALPQLKAFAGNNFKVVQVLHIFFDMVENIVRKGENAGYRHFLLFPQCFKKALCQGFYKVSLHSKELTWHSFST